ncbi:MAG: hypothetical protein HY900_10030, partial [Deltaproteobacteria bacterium]|nr:hypothetical protein [Deltaproteobacteria bacterium]
EAALRLDPINEELVRILYDIHAAQRAPVKARKVLEGYAAALRAERFPEAEIQETLESFWSKPS